MAFNQSLASGLQKCIEKMWKRDDTSDYTVVVENKSFKCHRLILSACSGFFQGLFNSGMKEQLENRVVLPTITASTFDIIINALYTGKEGLSNENVWDVWSATELLQIGYLQDECQEFVMKNISADNCFSILDRATLFAAQNVIDQSLNFIARHLKSVRGQDRLLQLSFDYFYKVIADDSLAADSEELVVDAVLDWVTYIPLSEQGNNAESDYERNDEQSDGDPSTDSVSIIDKPENIHGALMVLSLDITTDQTNTFPQSMDTSDKADTHITGPVERNDTNTDVGNDVSKREHRKQHLVQLMSACRLFTVNQSYLVTIMRNHKYLLVGTGAYTLMEEALVYITDVSRRHDTWPEAAVYRASCSSQHVVTFVCIKTGNLKNYNLNTGRVAELPVSCGACTLTTFDNNLYLLNSHYSTQGFHKLSNEKTWVIVNSMEDFNSRSTILLPHGNYIYLSCLCDTIDEEICSNDHSVYRLCPDHEHNVGWSKCGELSDCGDCLVRFHQYILVFLTKTDIITVQRYNTINTETTHAYTTEMGGTSQDMVSFKHREDVYILQRNGSLWKVFSTDTTPVDFKLVSKLWDFDCSIKGCVLYKQTLFIFCNYEEFKTTLTSLPGICTNIQIINIGAETTCLPRILDSALDSDLDSDTDSDPDSDLDSAEYVCQAPSCNRVITLG